METTCTWDDNPDGGTRMRLRNRAGPAGFSKLAAPIMASAMRRANHNPHPVIIRPAAVRYPRSMACSSGPGAGPDPRLDVQRAADALDPAQ